jgi:hypothetical protein
MAEEVTALVPHAERVIDFYGDPIEVAVVGDDEVYVPLRAITEFLGLDWSAQYRRIQRDEVLARRARMVALRDSAGARREQLSLPLDLLPGWLFGITASRVRPELAPKLTRYREECFRVLWRAFQADLARHAPVTHANPSLTHVRDLALAIVQMSEQQLALEAQVGAVRTDMAHLSGQQIVLHDAVSAIDGRVDRAALVIKELQRRLGSVEERIQPGSVISEAQAAEISSRVKALAQQLTAASPGKNHYQGIFGELYRRFGVTSYKLIRQEHYAEVLAFLDDWRGTTGVAAE